MSDAALDVIIVGGGIAGASLAYFLAERGVTRTVILEREEQPAFHATGRSAAVLFEFNRDPTLRRLIAAGAAFLRRPPAAFAESPLLDPAGGLLIADHHEWDEVQGVGAQMAVEGIACAALSRDEVLGRMPVLAAEAVAGGLWLAEDGHLDVHELLTGYLRGASRRGSVLRCRAEVKEILVERGRCVGVRTEQGPLRGRWVVNAAGAWAGVLGALAGAAPIPFSPLRRSVIVFSPPPELDVRRWPMTDHDAAGLYFKPESGALMASPMDQVPSLPCDARPTEEAVAEVADKLARMAPPLTPRAIRHKWAGLRTFAPDRVPVVGEDPTLPGFFWLAGQGGVGIETSPALGAIAAELLVTGRSDRFDAALLAPRRFRR